MLYYWLLYWMEQIGPLRVVQYPSFRIPAAALTSLVWMMWWFPRCIEWLKQWQRAQTNVRQDTPERHQTKQGTPTMGGMFLVLVVLLTSLLWADLSNVYIWVVLAVMMGFAAIGFADDYIKLKYRNSKGLPGKQKLGWQLVVLLVITAALVVLQQGFAPGYHVQFDTRISLPFVSTKFFHWDIGWYYIPFAWFVIMGTSHAVNLTDGLDGLAIGPTIVSSSTLALLAYVGGLLLSVSVRGIWVDFNVATYLNIPYVEGIGELAVVLASLAGAGIGFLWYNSFPASVFMGDVGSLALGGVLGVAAVLTKNEFVSALLHGVFLMEALSVIAQVISFRMTGKRVFRMAPIHHHFELKGWAEPKIIVRFWILSIVLALITLMSLKLR